MSRANCDKDILRMPLTDPPLILHSEKEEKSYPEFRKKKKKERERIQFNMYDLHISASLLSMSLLLISSIVLQTNKCVLAKKCHKQRFGLKVCLMIFCVTTFHLHDAVSVSERKSFLNGCIFTIILTPGSS